VGGVLVTTSLVDGRGDAPVRGDGRAPGAVRSRAPRTVWPYLFVLPTVVALLFGFGYPLVSVVRNSLYTGSIYSMRWVGLGNFRALAADDVFRTAVLNNLKLLLTVPVMTVLALVLAVLIHDSVRGGWFHRSAIFFPYILPAVGTGLAFSVFLSLNGGLNGALRAIGADALARDWLGSPDLAIWSVGGMVIWQQLGFGVVVFLAALLSLPPELTEAGRLDGASWWQLQTRVKLPQIRSTVEFFVITEAITVLSWVFTYVYVLTGGGPGNSSMVMEFYIWKEGFAQGAVGLANAAAVVVLILAAVLIAAYLALRWRTADGPEGRR
jgi:ABC-type sugar transport system permease subunit